MEWKAYLFRLRTNLNFELSHFELVLRSMVTNGIFPNKDTYLRNVFILTQNVQKTARAVRLTSCELLTRSWCSLARAA